MRIAKATAAAAAMASTVRRMPETEAASSATAATGAGVLPGEPGMGRWPGGGGKGLGGPPGLPEGGGGLPGVPPGPALPNVGAAGLPITGVERRGAAAGRGAAPMGGVAGEGTAGRGMSGFSVASGALASGGGVIFVGSASASGGAMRSPRLSFRLLGFSPTAGSLIPSAPWLAVESAGLEEGFGS